MTISQRDVELLNGYCNGSLTDREFSDLERRLRLSRDLRQLLVEYRAIESGLPSAIASGTLEQIEANSTKNNREIHRLQITLLALATGFLLMLGLYVFRSGGEPQIATVSSLTGLVRWTGVGGQMDEVQTERELTGGTIEGLSVDSSATIEFRDGTAVTISGLTTLTISDDGQKELHLGSGNLSAAVMEQQRGMPLLVETPAATLVVLGTQFDVTADQMRTEITVNKGHVRATRLTDGKALEIYAGHRAVASIEVRDDWRALEIEHGGHTWQADLMNDTTHGKWLSATTALKLELRLAMKAGIMTEDQAKQEFYRKVGDLDKNDGFVQALPMRLSDDVVYFVAVDVRADSGGVVLDERNRFRIQGRVKQSIEVQFGFSAIDRNSDAGGRHMKSLTQRKVEKTFDIVMPVDQFPVWNDKYTSPVGRDLVNVFCFTSSRDAELEITNVELLAD